MAWSFWCWGSGGPFVNQRQASSGYVLTVDGNALLVDAGGGACERLGRSGIAASWCWQRICSE
jgi:ribonuclease BN (tRNA processing enzyme)